MMRPARVPEPWVATYVVAMSAVIAYAFWRVWDVLR